MASPGVRTYQMRQTWADANPYCLVISAIDREPELIDLGVSGWATKYADLMRVPGLWVLSRKDGSPVLVQAVHEGEQPYYTARHVGVAGSSTSEIIAYGIGKKLVGGHMSRLWVLPNGVICGADDVDHLGIQMVKAGMKGT